MHEAFFSPFIIPVAGMALALGIILIGSITSYHTRKLRSEERLAAIARGLPLPEEPVRDGSEGYDPVRRMRGIRTGGIVTTSVGIGMALFSFVLTWILGDRDVLAVAAAGIIPFVVGIGLLIDYKVRAAEFERASQERIPTSAHV
jgi:hypothetical protein